MLLVTNTARFPLKWRSSSGVEGESRIAANRADFLRYKDDKDVLLIVDCNPTLAFQVAGALWWSASPPLLSLDLVLRRPAGTFNHLSVAGKRLLLRRFDHHIHLFRDLRGYKKFYGIGPERSSFVPFKPNLSMDIPPNNEGAYVLCFGRSLRDFDTFFDAVEQLPFPAAIANPNIQELRAHGARFNRSLDRLPPNVKLLPDENSTEAQVRILRGAKLVVLPVLKSSIVASGISTCLNAMLAGKCVIGSEGPGMSDLFTDEVLIVPAENPSALAATIGRAWENEDLRRRTAENGYRYAKSLGGEQDFYQRVIDTVVDWRLRTSGRDRTPAISSSA